MSWGSCTFNNDGGSGGETRTLWYNYGASKISYWSTIKDTTPSYRITSCNVPTKAGKRLKGYYASVGGLTTRIARETGTLETAISGLSSSMSATAWFVDDYALVTVGKNGGVGTEQKLYRKKSDGTCYSDVNQTNRIYSVAPYTKQDYSYGGVFVGGVQIIDENGAITAGMASVTINADVTIDCTWTYKRFGHVEDYFSLGSASLIPKSSEDGSHKPHVVAYNANGIGTRSGETPATEDGIAWMNPTVVYEVASDTTIATKLGKAFYGGNSKTAYMITSVEVKTSIGTTPTVTVSGVANEGADAVKTYSVSIPVSARHRPQNLMSAIHATNNGGDLQELTLKVSCDPVVVAENNLPCASDVCHGRAEAKAVINSYNGEAEPQAGSGFVQIGAPKSTSGVGYRTWAATFRKEMT